MVNDADMLLVPPALLEEAAKVVWDKMRMWSGAKSTAQKLYYSDASIKDCSAVELTDRTELEKIVDEEVRRLA